MVDPLPRIWFATKERERERERERDREREGASLGSSRVSRIWFATKERERGGGGSEFRVI